MKALPYVGHYDTADHAAEQRGYPLAAANKMTYIASAICRAGWQVEIVSASRTAGRNSCPGSLRTVAEGVTLRLFPSLGMGGLMRRVARTVQAHFHLLAYLLSSTKRGAPVLVYHSLGYAGTIWLARKLKGFRLILEVEEIYADVIGDEKARKREQRLFEAADAFVFSTELLDERVNPEKKPSTVIYGTYQVEPERNCCLEGEGIHCVYAGTLDPRKGGAMAAMAAGALPEGYHMHILGFGSEADKAFLETTIAAATQKGGACVTYDGVRHGEEYIRFLQSCRVGLSTQAPDAAFNGTSFPSKVLSYLSNGLRVVSIRMPSLERSAVSDLLIYYDENTPEAIANAIQTIDFTESYDSREFILGLDKAFVQSVAELLAQK